MHIKPKIGGNRITNHVGIWRLLRTESHSQSPISLAMEDSTFDPVIPSPPVSIVWFEVQLNDSFVLLNVYYVYVFLFLAVSIIWLSPSSSLSRAEDHLVHITLSFCMSICIFSFKFSFSLFPLLSDHFFIFALVLGFLQSARKTRVLMLWIARWFPFP